MITKIMQLKSIYSYTVFGVQDDKKFKNGNDII